ncbi:hypothetical protein F0L17_09925 [Streptomyces sp. TRM43335]|uniref:VWFA domain-containing protein n=1 Tax=Streptomyces taklimakanensis TaxID=2569853 RepID=A0A6G2BBI9_9ACTN|nr:hypothetical protein [Streptomyces taklimakanensis]MTE19439.1 hypothetical protein [Streptomyces taklimakanensis]
MTAELSLILNERPLPRNRLGEVETTSTNIAVLYPVGDGAWEIEGTRPRRWWQRPVEKSRRPCYAVDMGDHRRTGEFLRTPLPCRDQAHRFEATVDIGFRVHDPVELVRRGVRDGLDVVYGHLRRRLRAHTRKFAIDQADRAEEHINADVESGMRLPEGITVFHCVVHLEPDAEAQEYIRELTRSDRRNVLERFGHRNLVEETRNRAEIERIEQVARLEREEAERRALESLPSGVWALLQRHLIKHPEDTGYAVEAFRAYQESVGAREEIQDQRQTELLKFLVEKDVIRQADVPALREDMRRRIEGSAGAGAGAGAGDGTPAARRSLPATGTDGAPVMWGGSGGPGVVREPAAPAATGVVPIYVALDTSYATQECVGELGDALRSLQTALANSPDVSRAVRLSVVPFAERARVRLPSTTVGWDTDVPTLSAGGDRRYGALFETLLDRVPADVERLKRQVSPVHRPVVFLLTAGEPEDAADWPERYRQLGEHRYAPIIVACGIGRADPRTVVRLANPSELAYAAESPGALGEAVGQYSVFLQNAVLHIGRGAVAGNVDLLLTCPMGLRRITPDRVAGPTADH